MKTVRNILKFAVLPLVILISAVLLYIAHAFNKSDFKDDFDAPNIYLSHYPDSYDSAAAEFKANLKQLQNEYEGVEYTSIGVPSHIDKELHMGVGYIPAAGETKNLLILSSGVHGIEGYVGHAAQMLFLENFLNAQLLENTGVLLIHSVNPYGFKYHRRVTENNVDMNRNSPSTPDLYKTKNEGYLKVYNMINPEGKVKRNSLANRFFFIKAVNQIRKETLPVLRQAVLQGQYEYPTGLYYGGMMPEPQIDSLIPHIKKYTEPYNRIKIIDLHTGYGERGRLHLFPNPVADDVKIKMEALYTGYTIDWGDSDEFYTITGDFASFVGQIAGDKEFYPMLFEYGTLNSQTTLGSLKSIHTMIVENQGYQYGYASERDSVRVKKDILEMYHSGSDSWRNHIMQQTHEIFTVVIPGFTHSEISAE